MYPRSALFDKTISSSSFVVKTYVTAINGKEKINLKISDGQVNVSNDQDVRRTLDCNLVIDTNSKTFLDQAQRLLAPLSGTLLYAYRGFIYPNGTEEVLPVGVFTPTDCQIYDSGSGLHASVKGVDKARLALRQPLLNTLQVPAGTDIVSAITLILGSGGIFNLNSDISTLTVPNLIYEENDNVWTIARSLAKSYGMELYYDVYGAPVLIKIPDFKTVPVSWNYIEGKNATLNYVDRKLTEENSLNYVVVIGSNPSNGLPIRGIALDNNPASPTYTDGTFNVVSKIFRYSSIGDVVTATTTANALLQQLGGVTEILNLSVIPHPAFEINDVVYVERIASGVANKYVIQNISIPLTYARDMPLSMEKRRAI